MFWYAWVEQIIISVKPVNTIPIKNIVKIKLKLEFGNNLLEMPLESNIKIVVIEMPVMSTTRILRIIVPFILDTSFFPRYKETYLKTPLSIPIVVIFSNILNIENPIKNIPNSFGPRLFATVNSNIYFKPIPINVPINRVPAPLTIEDISAIGTSKYFGALNLFIINLNQYFYFQ